MSSFKRKGASSKPEGSAAGTRTLGNSVLVSSGIPSLDDVLGGGIPLSSSSIVFSSDPHSDYPQLVLKYSLAQGMASGHRICLLGNEDARQILHECLWMSPSHSQRPIDPNDDDQGQGIKIAWRYQQLKQFNTTVSSFSHDFCSPSFDLSCRIPPSVIEAGTSSGLLQFLELSSTDTVIDTVLCQLAQNLEQQTKDQTMLPLRILIPSFGGPEWGELPRESICRFLWKLRYLLRRHTNACACVAISPHLLGQSVALAEPWGWLSDFVVQFSPFSADPSLSQSFPAYHGFFHLQRANSPYTLLSPSDKGSQLRFGEGLGEGGENNLAFKCTKRRLILETVHLDVEGGVGERRTQPAAGISFQDAPRGIESPRNLAVANAEIGVELENVPREKEPMSTKIEPKKAKKSVAFQATHGDIYDF